jgi:hypothetical protein
MALEYRGGLYNLVFPQNLFSTLFWYLSRVHHPYNATMEMLVVVAARAGPNLLLSHIDIHSEILTALLEYTRAYITWCYLKTLAANPVLVSFANSPPLQCYYGNFGCGGRPYLTKSIPGPP